MVGEILKKKRKDLGLNLREISETLKIRYDYLKAIEEEDFKLLPAEVYLKGYILEYAKILNIDPDTIIKVYEQQLPPPRYDQRNKLEIETLQKKRSKIRYLLIPSILILLVIIIAFAHFPSLKQQPTPPISAVEKKIGNNTQVPSSSLTPSSSKEEIKEDSDNSFSLKKTPLHILEILATDTTWILAIIDETDSKEVLMKPGESIKWHAKNCFSLKIGNAGGVKLIFNGEKIEKLGEKGQVITIELPDGNLNT